MLKTTSKHRLHSSLSNSVDWERLTPEVVFLPFQGSQHWTSPLARKAVSVSEKVENYFFLKTLHTVNH